MRIVSTARTSDHPTKLYYSSNGTGTAATSLLDLDSFGGGALQSVKLTGVSGSAIAQYEYLGGVRSRAMKNGVNLDMGTGSGLQFDELGRPKQYAHMDGSTVRAGFDYHYDGGAPHVPQNLKIWISSLPRNFLRCWASPKCHERPS